MSKFFKALSLVVFAASFATMPVTVPNAIAGSLKVKGEKGVKKDKFKPFAVALNSDGEEKTIAKAGPFTIFARCGINDGGADFLEILATSDEAGWFGNDISGPNPAGDVQDVFELEVLTGVAVYEFEHCQSKLA